jgi:phage regulator Rha-like protein
MLFFVFAFIVFYYILIQNKEMFLLFSFAYIYFNHLEKEANMATKKTEIAIIDKEPRISSKELARGFMLDHKYVYELIQLYATALEEFGEIILKKQMGSGEIKNGDYKVKSKLGERKEYWLNEYQATFLVTTFKNTDSAITFKLNLIREFQRMRNGLESLKKLRSTEEWLSLRNSKKDTRKKETEAIKTFVEYAKTQGSNNADKYYQCFTKMENSCLFIIAGKYKNIRDMLSTDQLYQIETADKIVDKAIEEGIAKELPYKDIYQLAKSKVQWFASLYGQSEVATKMIEEAELLLLN